MQLTFRNTLIAIIALIAPAVAQADFTQLNGVGQTFTFSGSTSALSQLDTTPGLPAPFLPRLANGYDNFSFGSGQQVLQIQWTGAYNGAAGLRASGFRIEFFANNAGAVGTQLGPTIVAPIASVAETTSGGNHFRYTYTPVSPLTFAGGTTYWMSISAALDYGNDGIASPTRILGAGLSTARVTITLTRRPRLDRKLPAS